MVSLAATVNSNGVIVVEAVVCGSSNLFYFIFLIVQDHIRFPSLQSISLCVFFLLI